MVIHKICQSLAFLIVSNDIIQALDKPYLIKAHWNNFTTSYVQLTKLKHSACPDVERHILLNMTLLIFRRWS